MFLRRLSWKPISNCTFIGTVIKDGFFVIIHSAAVFGQPNEKKRVYGAIFIRLRSFSRENFLRYQEVKAEYLINWINSRFEKTKQTPVFNNNSSSQLSESFDTYHEFAIFSTKKYVL